MAQSHRADSRVDLHLHTTCSDGAYSPAQVVDLARRAGLPALAITDHDTTAAWPEAQAAARGTIEVIPGVEITADFAGREFHLLAYFFQPEDTSLLSALAQLRRRRSDRFRELVDQLRPLGVCLDSADVDAVLTNPVVGRRHLAELLVATRHVSTVRQAFTRYLGDRGDLTIPPVRLPLAQALAMVHQAGGIAACAHPSYDCTRETLAELKRLGLDAVEVDYPGFRAGRTRRLRTWAAQLGLAVTGGSDCHGPGNHYRDVGAHGITLAELEVLRQLATHRGL
jgi:predicted metal-dependent phosphoesterase TrpH